MIRRCLCSSLVAMAIAVGALLVAAVSQRQAADAGATARVARAAAEAPRPACVEPDAPAPDRLAQLALDVDKARACAVYLYVVVRQLVVAWPARPRIPEPPPWCALPVVDADGNVTAEVLPIGRPGEQREWRGVVLRPGRDAAGPATGAGTSRGGAARGRP